MVLASLAAQARLPGARGRAAHDPVVGPRGGRSQAPRRRGAVRLGRRAHLRVARALDRAAPVTGVDCAHGHALPNLPILRSHMRSRDRDRGQGGGLRPRRRRRRLQPRLHLPEGVRDQAAPRGPGPPHDSPDPPRRRARRGELGRGIRGDRPPARAPDRRAREERGGRVPRQSERAQPVGAHPRAGVAAGAGLAERVLGLDRRSDAEAGVRRADVRRDAVGPDPGRGQLRPPDAAGREPARLERQPAHRARHARAACAASASAAARSWWWTRAARAPPRRRTSTTSSSRAPTPCCSPRWPARSSRRDSTRRARSPST